MDSTDVVELPLGELNLPSLIHLEDSSIITTSKGKEMRGEERRATDMYEICMIYLYDCGAVLVLSVD